MPSSADLADAGADSRARIKRGEIHGTIGQKRASGTSLRFPADELLEQRGHHRGGEEWLRGGELLGAYVEEAHAQRGHVGQVVDAVPRPRGHPEHVAGPLLHLVVRGARGGERGDARGAVRAAGAEEGAAIGRQAGTEMVALVAWNERPLLAPTELQRGTAGGSGQR